MKKIYMLLLLGLFSGSLTAQIPNYVPSNGLVGWWPFNGNANDESGNGNNGVISGTPFYVNSHLNQNSAALSLNGLNDKVDLNVPSLSNLGNSVSFSMWIKKDQVYTYSSLYFLRNGVAYSNGFNVSLDQNNATMGAGNCRLAFAVSNSTNVNIIIPMTQLQNWNNLIGTYDGFQIKLYLNGNLVASDAFSGNINSPSGNVVFSDWDNPTPPSTPQRSIDDIGIWNRALTQQEITNLYNSQTLPTCSVTATNDTLCAGASATLTASSSASNVSACASSALTSNLQTGLVGYWPFCGNANDASGNGNNGTVNGATLTTDRFGNANSAYNFDGVDDWINLPPGTGTNLNVIGNYTISLWLKSSQTNYSSHITFGDNVNSTNGFLFNKFTNSNSLCFYTGNNWNLTNCNVNDNTWIHFTVVANGNTLTVYRNNVLCYTNNSIVPCTSWNGPRMFGVASQGNTGFYAGILDDITIWNRALTPSEIQQLYNQGQTTYSWSNGATTPSITVSSAQTTTYTCTVTANGQSCSGSQSIAVIPAPTITATNSALCAGASTTLTASSSASNVSACASSVLPSNLQTGLVGYWPFCGNANDASGNGNNGTVNGATLTTDRFGNLNNAYDFNGNTIEIPHNTSLGFNPTHSFTVSFWFLKNSNNSPQHFMGKRSVFAHSFNWQFACETSQTSFGSGYGPGIYNGVISNIGQSNGVWTHICGNYSNGIWILYINGIQISINNLMSSPIDVSSLTFGNSGGFQSFIGKLDDIAIWNRALSAAEIQQLYNQGQTTYSWSNGATTPSITVSPEQTTTYTCTVNTNGTSCSSDVIVTVNPLPTVNAGIDQTVCVGTVVTLLGSGANTYSWNNGVNNGVAFTPASTATYTVTGTNTATGCTNTDEVLVTVNTTAPVANAGADFTKTCVQNPSGLGIGASSVAGVSYSWSPSTGLSSSTVSNPVANPLVTSTYTVTATNTASGCTASDQVLVTVNTTAPVANAGADFTKTCVQNPSGLGIGASSVAGVSYNWTPATGLSSYTVSNPVANPLVTSNYTVIATNTASGCTASDQVLVTVNNALPTVNAGNDQTVCAGTAVTLSGTGANTYSWNNSVSNSVAFTPVSTATYTVTGTNTTTGCTNTDQVVVNVNPIPNFVQPNDQVVCCQTVLSPIVFASSFPGTSFSWQAQQNPNVTGYPLSGTGIIPSMTLTNSALNTQSVIFTVTPSLNGCSGTPVSFSINVLPCSVFVVQPSSQTACAGSNLNPVLFSGNYTSVNWINTNTQTGLPISGTGDIAQALLTNGTSNTITSSFMVVPTYTDPLFLGASCQGPSQSFTISVLPLPTVSAGPDQELCQGQSATLFGSGANTYSWSNNVTNGVGFLPTVTQDYVVSGTNVATGCVNVDTVTVVVHPLPVVSAGVDQTVCKGDSISLTGSGAQSYQWNNNVIDGVSFAPQSTQTYSVTGTDANGCSATDGVTVSVSEPSFSTLTESALDSYTLNGQTYTQSGTYTQVITNASGCDSTITLNLTLSFTGLEGLNHYEWNIYPNPTHDHLTIECMHEVNERFRLMDAAGRLVLAGNLAGKKTELVLTELSTGVYTLCIGNVSFRVVKQ